MFESFWAQFGNVLKPTTGLKSFHERGHSWSFGGDLECMSEARLGAFKSILNMIWKFWACLRKILTLTLGLHHFMNEGMLDSWLDGLVAWVDCQVLGSKRFLFGHWSLKTLRIGRRADSASANGLQKTYFCVHDFFKTITTTGGCSLCGRHCRGEREVPQKIPSLFWLSSLSRFVYCLCFHRCLHFRYVSFRYARRF